jgi:hypothetical protein
MHAWSDDAMALPASGATNAARTSIEAPVAPVHGLHHRIICRLRAAQRTIRTGDNPRQGNPRESRLFQATRSGLLLA